MERIVGKTKYNEQVTFRIAEEYYEVEVVNLDDDEKKSKKDKKGKVAEGIGNYKKTFSKNSIEMRGVEKLSADSTLVQLKFSGERLKFVFTTETPYDKVRKMIE